jgi:hypothetical protein
MVGVSGFLLIGGLAKASEALGPLSVPIWLAAIAGAVVVLKGRIGEMILTAIAERDQELPEGEHDGALIHEVDELRSQVAELQERLDFTERLVTREREVRGLNAGDER